MILQMRFFLSMWYGSIAIRPVVGRRRLGTVPIFQQAGSRRVEVFVKAIIQIFAPSTYLIAPYGAKVVWILWYAAEQHHKGKCREQLPQYQEYERSYVYRLWQGFPLLPPGADRI